MSPQTTQDRPSDDWWFFRFALLLPSHEMWPLLDLQSWFWSWWSFFWELWRFADHDKSFVWAGNENSPGDDGCLSDNKFFANILVALCFGSFKSGLIYKLWVIWIRKARKLETPVLSPYHQAECLKIRRHESSGMENRSSNKNFRLTFWCAIWSR